MRGLLKPRVGPAWQNQAREMIDKLSTGHRLVIRPGGEPRKGCYPNPRVLDLVTLRFDFKQRPGYIVVARFQRIYAVHFLRALREAPMGIVVGYGGTGVTATYRSTALQAELHAKNPQGTAPPCQSYHEAGLAADCVCTVEGRRTMEAHGFHSGASFGDPSHYSFRAVG